MSSVPPELWAIDPARRDEDRQRVSMFREKAGWLGLGMQDNLAAFEGRQAEQLPDDKALLAAATKEVVGQNPNLEVAELQALAKTRFEILRAQRDAKQKTLTESSAARQSAVGTAIDQGAAITRGSLFLDSDQWAATLHGKPYLPNREQLQYEQAKKLHTTRIPGPNDAVLSQGQRGDGVPAVEPKYGPGMAGQGAINAILWGLNAGSRGVAGGSAGVLSALQELTSDVQPGQITITKPDPAVFDVPEVSSPHGVRGPISMGKALSSGPHAAETRVAGIPVAEALNRLTIDKAADVVKRGAQYAFAAAKADEPQAKEDFVTYLQGVQEHYQKLAVKRTIGAHPDAKPEELIPLAKEEYDRLVQTDVAGLAVRNPNAAQFLHQMVLDPLNIVTPAKVAGWLGKVPPVGKAMRGAESAARAATTAVRYMPELDALEMAAKNPELGTGARKSAEEMASLARLAPAEAQGTVRTWQRSTTPHMEALKKLDPDDTDLLWQVATGETEMDVAFEAAKNKQAFLEALSAHDQLRKAHGDLRELTGVGQDFRDGELKSARELELPNYVPERLKEQQVERRVHDVFEGQTQIKPGSTYARESKAPPIRDVAKQWEAEIAQISTPAESAAELKKLREYAEKKGFYLEVGADDRDVIPKLKAFGTRTTGVEWTELGPNLQAVLERVTGKPGITKPGASAILVDSATAAVMQRIAPVIAGHTNDLGKAAQVVKEFNDYAVRPAQKVWRTMKTTMNPGFAPRNFASAFGLDFVAHGFKAFPKQPAAFGIALMGAGIGETKMRNMVYTLRSGKKVSLGQIVDLFDHLGIVNQLDWRLGAEMVGKGAGSKVAGAVEKLPETLSPFLIPLGKEFSLKSMASVTENFQHATVALGFLDDLSPEGVAKMMDQHAKFAGDYRRLGSLEKAVLKETFGFYAWMRFVYPLTVKQLTENPARLEVFENIRQTLQRKNQGATPFSAEGLPTHLKDLGVSAPLSSQPPKVREIIAKYAKDGKLPAPGSHEYAVMTMEEPLTLGLQFLPLLENTVGKNLTQDADIYSVLGPLTQLALQGVSKVRGTADLGDVVKDVSTGYYSSQERTWGNLYKLYLDSGNLSAAEDLRIRYQIYRDFSALGALIEKGAPGQSIDMPGLPPFTSTFVVNPYEQAMRRKRKAAEAIPPTTGVELR